MIYTTHHEVDKHRTGMRAALAARAGLAPDDGRNPFRGFSLMEMARACLAAAGVRDVPGDKSGAIVLALTHSTSDFPALLSNVAQKSMMKGYEEADETFQLWTTVGSITNFKPAQVVGLGSFPALRKVQEGAEYKFFTTGDRSVTRTLATYGERFAITRQALINDDVGAFTRVPRKLGRAAIRTVGDMVYAVLTANPTMSDGTALFHTTHGNLLGAASLSTAGVDAMRVGMARQKDVGQTTGGLGIRMKHVIVPVSLHGVANQVRDAEHEVGTSAKNNTVPNYVRGTFDVVSDARLDEVSTSVWYGAADGNVHDTVEVAYLDGVSTPTLEQMSTWAADGVEFKVRMEAVATPLDWKTLARCG